MSTAKTSLEILINLTKLLNTARERSQTSKDPELKDTLSSIYDEVLALKEAVSRLTAENTQLRSQISGAKAEPEARQVGEVNYIFVCDKGPYCVPCYRGKDKLSN